MKMNLPKVLAIVGVILLIIGLVFAFVPVTQEVWQEKSYLLASETTEISPYIGHQELLTYLFLSPEDVRNLKLQGTLKSIEGGNFSFEVTDGELYFKAENVSEKSFEISVEPEELTNGLWLKIKPANVTVSTHIEAIWEQRTYSHVLGGLLLGGILGFFGFILLIAALVVYLIRRPKVTVEVQKKT